MQIACPSCAAEYEVPASRMKPGRKARCTRCGTEWTLAAEAGPAPEPKAAEPEPAAPPPPEITAMDRLAAVPPRPPRSAALAAAWLLTFFVLIGGSTSAIVWRAAVMRAWAPSSHILLLFDHPPEKLAGPASQNSNDRDRKRD